MQFNESDRLFATITAVLDMVPRERLDAAFMEWIARVRSVIDANGDSF
jgi:hypothetical protein